MDLHFQRIIDGTVGSNLQDCAESVFNFPSINSRASESGFGPPHDQANHERRTFNEFSKLVLLYHMSCESNNGYL
jgi:hypothetical protein